MTERHTKRWIWVTVLFVSGIGTIVSCLAWITITSAVQSEVWSVGTATTGFWAGIVTLWLFGGFMTTLLILAVLNILDS